MKAINWVVLAILTALSIVFVSLYFMLRFNLVDWPQGLVLGIAWWAAIIAVGVCLFIQKRHFDNIDAARDKQANNGASKEKTVFSKNKASIGTAVMSAILVPALAFCPCFSSGFSYADEFSSSSAASVATTAVQAKASKPKPSDYYDPWYYKLSPDSTGVYLMYSIKGSPLKQLQPGEVLSAPHPDPVEFYVRPKTGYLVDSTFLHSGNEFNFVSPTSKGTYSKIGTNELPGFEDATKEALEIGCTKEFHYSFREGSAWRYSIYREFEITIKPFAVKASFDLNGGTIDGSSTYIDTTTYYGTNVEDHSNDDLIAMPEATPIKEGYDFTGWTAGNSTELEPSGADVDIDNYWRYLYDHSNDVGATLPFTAQWKQEDATTETPADTPSDDPEGKPADTPADKPSDTTEGTPAVNPDVAGGSTASGTTGSASDSGSNSATGSTSGTENSDSNSGDVSGTDPDNGDASDPATGGTDEEPGALKGSPVTSQGTTQGTASGTVAPAVTTANGITGVNHVPEDNPMSGDVEHGLKLAAQQRTAGTLPDDTPLKDSITAGTNALRDGVYMVEDLINDDPVAMGYGISYANRGCWVCDYLKAGIIITLLYGAIVLVYRAARRGRHGNDTIAAPTTPASIGKSA